jgi:hypothetical protein
VASVASKAAILVRAATGRSAGGCAVEMSVVRCFASGRHPEPKTMDKCLAHALLIVSSNLAVETAIGPPNIYHLLASNKLKHLVFIHRKPRAAIPSLYPIDIPVSKMHARTILLLLSIAVSSLAAPISSADVRPSRIVRAGTYAYIIAGPHRQYIGLLS